ncbi:MAG: cadmium-translocating P-type ATPase [Planctomycetia bacterium]|nr:cadmium-translocating P-type ATPase [Planctomycetia bacterium]
MTEKTRIELRLVLPDLPDERDACVARLESRLGRQRGITRGHVVYDDGRPASLCLHYDPDVLSLAEVERVARSAGAEIHDRYGHALLELRAVGAEDAAARIEAAFRTMPGVVGVSASIPAQRMRVEFERSHTSVTQLQAALQDLGYASRRPREPEHDHDGDGEHDGWIGRNREFVMSLATGLLLAAAWIGENRFGIPHRIAIGLYLAAYLAGGFDLLRHLFGGLLKGSFRFDIDLLMLLAAVGAAVMGEWVEGAFLLFLFSLAHALEHYALGRARNAIRALSDLAPAKAIVQRDGVEQEVLVETVRVGETVIVHPAQRIPVDGTVRAGHSAVDQAPITGESVPVEKTVGDEVFAGTVNGTGALEVTTSRAAGDRTLDRVVRMVEEAQTQKAPTQRFTDKFERIFVPGVLIADVLLIFVPPLLGIWSWDVSFYRGMALLVAASPCALALGTPSTVLAGIAQAARKGVLIKGGAHLEALGSARAIAFDKTGTLTAGKPQVTDLLPMPGVSEAELLRITAAVERRSQHPLAAAIVRRAEADRIELPETSDVESVTARGVRSTVEEQVVEIGSLRLFEGEPAAVPEVLSKMVADLQQRGRSVMVVRHGGRWLGAIGLADAPRPHVRRTLNRLRELGIETLIMLTGDNKGVAEAIGREVGIDQIRAGLLPEDKVAAIRELLQTHDQVVMVGDGVNDAPALANATVGIAMGGAGTAAALETADVALMGDDVGKLPFAIGLSRRARRIIAENLVIALGTIVVLSAATTLGFARIGPAVMFHEGSTLVVILNSLRLLAYRQDLGESG